MFWESVIKKIPNFARVFYSGAGFLLTLPLAAMIHPSMAHQRIDFLASWLCGTFVFLTLELACYGYRSYRNNWNGRPQVPREKKLTTMSYGMEKLVMAAVMELIAFGIMERDLSWSFTLFDLSWGFATIAFCSQIVENSYMCKFPERYNELNIVMAMVSLFVVVCAVFECMQVTCILMVYLAFIACLLTDLFMINFHPSEIHFLGDYIGKRVICKDLNGNEYRGDFMSVDNDFDTSKFMRLVLKNVEKESDGKFVFHADSVYVDEISSLQLANEVAIVM
ncbi:hypothetical protein CAEBREN_18987 [Caenorhabditis brenneri]|uniref:Uncharacterized protein n=1 Tax=Caenorhabditis brenneri TaxID=135651 RepID=G0MGK6_CAEBE|nr:hypothetical protein CAEBREN_18987 [Caenorhabditis brenneri]